MIKLSLDYIWDIHSGKRGIHVTDEVMDRILACERNAASRISDAKAAAADAVARAEAESALSIADAESLCEQTCKAARTKAEGKAAAIIEKHEEAAFIEAERIIREASAKLDRAIAAVAGEIMNYGNK